MVQWAKKVPYRPLLPKSVSLTPELTLEWRTLSARSAVPDRATLARFSLADRKKKEKKKFRRLSGGFVYVGLYGWP